MKRITALFVALLIFNFSINTNALSTAAKAAVLINGDTGEIIYSQNNDERLPMASTTKIMTGLLLCEYGNFDREITVTAEMLRVEGSSMGLLAGDKVTLHDLLYGLMLASGNDAANVIAYTVSGSLEDFVALMNKKAKQLGLANTHFETPSGLDGETHYTTALDLANLARFAMQNKDFAKAVSTKKAVLNYGNPPYRRSLINHNKILNYFEDSVGIKTGFTKKSGRCLVSAAKRDGKFVIAVTLNDPNDWQDHCNMLEYGLGKIIQTTVSPKNSSYNIPVVNGLEDNVLVKVEPFVVNSLNTEEISYKIYLPKFVYAPIKNGEKIGSVVYLQGDNVLAETDILATKNIMAQNEKKSVLKCLFQNFKYILSNI